MRFFHKILLALTLMMASQAKAFTPESGFWWNPNEPGSGYTIEIQDNFLFIIAYVYDDLGNPIWYTAAQTMEGNAIFDSELDYTYNGPCIDCNYTQPITIEGERGPITITFISESTAELQFQGAVKNIQRFNFILGDELNKMRGEWQIVIDQSNLVSGYPYFADALIFDDAGYDSDIDLDVVIGCRSESTYFYYYCTDDAYDNSVYAYYDADDDLLYAVVEHDSNNFLTYKVRVGLQQFDGDAYFYQRGTTPNFNVEGFLVRGFRTASRTFTETGTGPSRAAPTKDDGGFKSAQAIPLAYTKTLSQEEYAQLENKKQNQIVKQLELFLEMNKKLKALK